MNQGRRYLCHVLLRIQLSLSAGELLVRAMLESEVCKKCPPILVSPVFCFELLKFLVQYFDCIARFDDNSATDLICSLQVFLVDESLLFDTLLFECFLVSLFCALRTCIIDSIRIELPLQLEPWPVWRGSGQSCHLNMQQKKPHFNCASRLVFMRISFVQGLTGPIEIPPLLLRTASLSICTKDCVKMLFRLVL
ncbi:hypothetical protein KCV07_g311, partial [Aureobasidium melanogenum]